jgi:hypothetical protein
MRRRGVLGAGKPQQIGPALQVIGPVDLAACVAEVELGKRRTVGRGMAHPGAATWLLQHQANDQEDAGDKGNNDEQPEETVQPAEAVIDELMGTEVHLMQRYRSSLSIR